MELPPRPPAEHVITPEMWITVGLVGLVMSIATLLVFDASLPGGLIEGTAGIRHGRTMAFTTLVLCQLFNAFNSRSNEESAFVGMLAQPLSDRGRAALAGATFDCDSPHFFAAGLSNNLTRVSETGSRVYLFPAPFYGLSRPTSLSFDVVSQQ